MKLVSLSLPNSTDSVYINPAHVVSVRKTFIGHENRGVIGTKIVLSNNGSVTTDEKIVFVVGKLTA